MRTDVEFMEHVLEDGRWHSRDEIIALSEQLRGYGLTVHSRAADLRKRGHVVESRLERDRRGRILSYYRLVTLDTLALDSASRASVSSVPAPASPADGPSVGGLSFPADPAGTLSKVRGFDSRRCAPAARPEDGRPGRPDQPQGELFECVVDESAGMRGAYWGDAA